MNNKNYINNEIIDIKELYFLIKNNLHFIKKTTIFFLLFGLLTTLILPNKYKSSTTFIPQISNELSQNSSISGLASLAGINLNDVGEKNNNIPPSLYPQIIKSTYFNLEFLDAEIKYNEDVISLREYYNENKSFLSKIYAGTFGFLLKNLKKLIDGNEND